VLNARIFSHAFLNTIVTRRMPEATGARLSFSSFRCFRKLRKATISFVMSVRLSAQPHGTNRLPLKGISLNLLFEYFSKICPENASFIKYDKYNWQHCTCSTVHAAQHTFCYHISMNSSYNDKRFIQKLKRKSKHILCSVTFSPKVVPL